MLAAESFIAAGALHLAGNVENLSEQLLFFGVGPLQMMDRARPSLYSALFDQRADSSQVRSHW